jgi:hypothetical protein
MKTKLMMLTLLVIVGGAIALNVSIAKKDGLAVNNATQLAVPGGADQGTSIVTGGGSTRPSTACNHAAACNVDASLIYPNGAPKDGSRPNVKNCAFAVYIVEPGAAGARTCAPRKTAAAMEVPSLNEPRVLLPTLQPVCSQTSFHANVNIHSWSYNSQGDILSNSNAFMGSYASYPTTPTNGGGHEQTPAEFIRSWDGINACKEMKAKAEREATIRAGKSGAGAGTGNQESGAVNQIIR